MQFTSVISPGSHPTPVAPLVIDYSTPQVNRAAAQARAAARRRVAARWIGVALHYVLTTLRLTLLLFLGALMLLTMALSTMAARLVTLLRISIRKLSSRPTRRFRSPELVPIHPAS